MPKGISLHVGLNTVDKKAYTGYKIPDLVACEFDALDMAAIAIKQGFKVQTLLSASATYEAVTRAIASAAERLISGDFFLLTYSGHGGQVPDLNGDEGDRLDETWVLYDRELLDDELYSLWAKFAPGVRIVLISDSCHSGSVARSLRDAGQDISHSRVIPDDVSRRVYRANRSMYDAAQRSLESRETTQVAACGILISGCQDYQVASDGVRNGLFTEKLLQVWNSGAFSGSHRAFRDAIAKQLPRTQTPNYYLFGARSSKFSRQNPFTI